jgi:8-oxo-dGTP pyrophosphatase MutT (NUDIX family)
MNKDKIEEIKKLAEESLLENTRVEINEDGVPCFFAIGGEDAYREGEAPGNREAVMAVVKHQVEEKFLLLKWNKIDWHTFITGGIEDGQTAEEAARAEVLEETGYKNLKLIKRLSDVSAKFYHSPKQTNRTAHFQNFYFELEDDEQEEVAEKEKKQHSILWTKKEDVEDLLTASGMKFIWLEICA